MKRIMLVILGAIAAAAAIEVMLRFFPVASSMAYQPTTPAAPIMRGKPNYDYVYSKGWNFRMEQHGHLNNFGYPAERDYIADQRNIVVIGDSFVEGLMVPPAARIQSQMEELLNHSISVYGLGRSGSELAQYLGVAQWAATVFRPEALVFNLVDDDVNNSLDKKAGDYNFDLRDGGCRMAHTDRPVQPAFLAYARESALYEYLVNNLKLLDVAKQIRRFSARDTPRAVVGTDTHVAVSQCFFQLLGNIGGLPKDRLIFVINGDTPTVYSGQQVGSRDIDVFADVAERAGYPVIRMQAVFQAAYAVSKSRYDFRPIDAHWNERAHRLAAQAVVDKLLQAPAYAGSPSTGSVGVDH